MLLLCFLAFVTTLYYLVVTIATVTLFEVEESSEEDSWDYSEEGSAGDEVSKDSNNSPTSFTDATVGFTVVKKAKLDDKRELVGFFVCKNFGKQQPDWAIGEIVKPLEHATFTHEVDFGDGVNEQIIRACALVKDTMVDIALDTPKWGDWVLLKH